MIHGAMQPFSLAIDRGSATAAGTITGQTIDTIVNGVKQEYLTIPMWSTTADVVSNCPTVLKLQEADVTNTSSFADVVAFVGGTATSSTVGYVIVNEATATQQGVKYIFNVNLLPRKRYVRVMVSPATSQTWSALAIFSRAGQSPTTIAGWGGALQEVHG